MYMFFFVCNMKDTTDHRGMAQQQGHKEDRTKLLIIIQLY